MEARKSLGWESSQRRGFSRKQISERILRRELLQGGLRERDLLYRDIGRATGKKDTSNQEKCEKTAGNSGRGFSVNMKVNSFIKIANPSDLFLF